MSLEGLMPSSGEEKEAIHSLGEKVSTRTKSSTVMGTPGCLPDLDTSSSLPGEGGGACITQGDTNTPIHLSEQLRGLSLHLHP